MTTVEMSEVRFSKELWNDLDEMSHDLDESVEEQNAQMRMSAEAAAGVGISLTAGFLAAMPSWRNFDPMPVLSADEKSRKGVSGSDEEDGGLTEGDGTDEKVDELFER